MYGLIKDKKMIPTLFIIVPCYNEENVLPVTAPIFADKINELISKNKVSKKSCIMFVNDGSKDATWDIIKELSKNEKSIIGISQSRNRGHQNALLAGLMESMGKCDVTISIDCDGQDDINAMDRMIDEYLNGSEIVYGVRSQRKSDSLFKKYTAEIFYKVLIWMGAEIIFNHADYRLLSSKVLKEFSNFKEVNIFLRGIVPLVGFKSTSVYYERHERLAGESHYPLSKMFSLAFDGITSLSVKPIRLITGLGVIFSILSLTLIIYAFLSFLYGTATPGWTSTLMIVCFIGGVQMISLGVIGEYIGKIYLETKARPRYIISDRTTEDEVDEGY